MLTLPQINWASEHEWFVRAEDGGVLVVEDVPGEPRLLVFHNFEFLKAWAGY